MTIAIGDKLPEATFKTVTADGPANISTADIFAGKKVALFAVPGAYTPTCHQKHLPGFLNHMQDLKSKGVDTVACTAVNDIFVLDFWAKDTGSGDSVVMLADGSAKFAKATGLEIDLTDHGLGVRSKRYAMLVDDGVVKVLNIDDAPPVHDKSSAETLCSMIGDRL